MTLTLLIALAASFPLAGLGILIGLASERACAGPRLRTAVWSLALLVPMLIAPVSLAIEAADFHSPLAVVRPLMSEAPVAPAPSPVLTAEAPAAPEPVDRAVRAGRALPLIAMLVAVLAAGAAAAWTSLFLRVRRLRRLVADARPCGDEELIGRLAEQARRIALPPPALRIDPRGSAPLLAGVWRPTILLPSCLLAQLPAERIALICAHELAHLKRRDNLKIVVESVLVGLFWFNPLLRIAQSRLSGAREEVCDALALAAAEQGVRRAYAQSLFSALSLAAQPAPALAFTGHRTEMVRRRLRAILKPVAAPFAAAPATVALGAVLLACAGLASVAMAASPPARERAVAAASAAVTRVAATVRGEAPRAVTPAPAPPRAAGSPSQVRFEIRMVSLPERMLADVFTVRPRVDGYAFVADPVLHSTYDDGPTLPILRGDDIDQVLARFSRNELNWRKTGAVSVKSGATISLDRTALFGPARTPIMVTSPAATFSYSTDGTTPLDRMFPSAATSQFTLALQPTVTSSGGVRLRITADTQFPSYPVMRMVRDSDVSLPEIITRVSVQGGQMFVTTLTPATETTPTTIKRYPAHQEATGETMPAVRRTASSVMTLARGQVVAIAGVSNRRDYPVSLAPTAGDMTTLILIRPIVEAAH